MSFATPAAVIPLPRKPKPSALLRWDIYRTAAKAKWISTVEVVDANSAIKLSAKEFNV
jgi:hypothetical protein